MVSARTAIDVALVAYARREISAAVALARIVEACGGTGKPWAVLAQEKGDLHVVAGVTDSAGASALAAAAAQALGRRFLSTRAGAPAAFSALAEDVDFIAVEPITSRAGAYLGALAIAGTAAGRADMLGSLPPAALVCADVAFELLCRPLVSDRIHTLNNVLSVLSANLDHVVETLSASGGDVPEEERETLVVAAGHAHTAARTVFTAAAALREALPYGDSGAVPASRRR